MQLDYLREFIVFSRYLNFSKAATYLNIAQPTLSTHISAMEKELGFGLVERSKQLALTSAGKQFCVDAERILSDYDNSVNACLATARKGSGCIIVETPIPIGGLDTDLNFLVAVTKKNFPGIRLEKHVSSNLSLSEALLEEVADAGIIQNERMLDLHPELKDRMATIDLPRSKPYTHSIWMHESNPLASRESIDVSELGKTKFLIPSSASYSVLEELAKMANGMLETDISVSHWPGSYDDSILNIKDDECMVVTEDDRMNQLYSMRSDRVFVPLVGMDEVVKPQIVYLKDNKNPALQKLPEIIAKYTEYVS